MILACLKGQAKRHQVQAEAVRLAADHMVRFNDGDLDRAFWCAHRRFDERDQTFKSRRFWRDVLDEIN